MKNSISLRSFIMATWLGWQIESNWADPLLFAIYSVIKPLSGALILVVMYSVIMRGNFDTPLFPYMYIGNAFYIYVGAIMTGISWSVIEDREHYKTLKYMYIAPINIQSYLVGRGVARFLTGSLSVLITLLAGVLFLKVPIHIAEVNWGLFIVSLLLGLITLATMGLLLGSISLLLVHHAGFVGEATAGALYTFSGAVFPISVLPAFIRPLGFMMPITYWLELIRRSLIGDIAQSFPTLAQFSNLQLMGILVGMTFVFGILAEITFRYCDHQARERGLIDRTTNY